MPPIPPFWFTQRQCKAQPAGENALQVTAPNLKEMFLAVRPEAGGRWSAALRVAADGPDVASTGPDFETVNDAWGAAFELYRRHVII
jgi:hypothetical protein